MTYATVRSQGLLTFPSEKHWTLCVRSPAVETRTCANCPHFNDFHEPNGRGWCRLFNHDCKEHHEKTQDCINSSDLEVTHEIEDNLEFFPEVELEEVPEAAPVKTARPKQILRHKQETVDPNSDNDRYTVIRTWDNGSVYQGSRVESLLINSPTRRKPCWETVIKSQKMEKGNILRRGLGGHLVKA